MKRFIISLISLFFVSTLSFGQVNSASISNFDKAKLDAYFDTLAKQNRFMGSIALAQNGQIIYQRSLGFQDVEKNRQATAETKYRIGSISKSFTAALIMKAVESNKLHLDQSLSDFYPNIKNSDRITIELMLNHRSGIHNFTDDADFRDWYTQVMPEEEMVALITSKGVDFEPNEKSSYSNSNYVLLTYILEKVYQKSYAELLKELIVQPIGLQNTYLGRKINPNNEEANSYYFSGSWNQAPETDPSVPLGAGMVVSTPTDLLAFSSALFEGKIVAPESLKRMQTVNGNFGLGLIPIPFFEYLGWGHTGGIDGFTSVYAYFPESKVAYALTSNGTTINNNDITIAALSAVFRKPFELPNFEVNAITEADAQQYIGTYASSVLPLKISFSFSHGQLFAQATGQAAFPLEVQGNHVFTFKAAGIEIVFNPIEKSFVLKQGGGEFTFVKE